MATSHKALLLGTRKGLFTVERNGNGWDITNRAFAGAPVSYAINDPRNGTIWAGLDHGHWGTKLHRSKDGGNTWEEIEAPKYPEGAEIKEGIPATTRYLWVMAPGATSSPERFYIGTEPGGLFVSDDGGDTWQINDALWNHSTRTPEQWFGGGRDEPGIHSIIVDPTNSDHMYVAISCAGVFETTDGGKSWEPRNKGLHSDFMPNPVAEVGHDPHLVVACPGNLNAMWQQNHMGIYRSTDAAQTWQNVSGGEGSAANFGFAVAVDENDPETAWVVPGASDGDRVAINGALRVTRTEDGGKTWQDFTEGLPQEHCYDMAYRHGLDISGDTLAFGTTSGNAYVSDNRGETWQSLGSNFPLIYSVRFMR